MKLTKIATTALLAFAGAAFVGQSAQASGTALSYNSGDLFLGIHGNATTTQDILVDLGPATSFTGASQTAWTDVGAAIGSDLVSTFGADWYSNSTLKWGIFTASGASGSNGDPSRTLYASSAQVGGAAGLNPWTCGSFSAQGVAQGKMLGVEGAYSNAPGVGQTYSAADNSVLYVQPLYLNGNPAPNTYYSQTYNKISFGDYNPTIETTVASVLDLYKMPVFSGSPAPAGKYEGSFALDSTGQLSYVPEPATAALTGFGALLAFMRRRNRK